MLTFKSNFSIIEKKEFGLERLIKNKNHAWAQWCMPAIPVLGKQRQKDRRILFEASMDYKERPVSKI
jgi:hypothetical protein